MIMKVSLEVKLDSVKALDRFKKDFRKEIIEFGLDDTLQQATKQLKSELRLLVNNKVQETNSVEDQVDPTQATQINTETPLPSKSTEDLINFITGANPKKHMPQGNYNTIDGSNMLTAQFSRNVSGPNRIDLRIAISPGESIQEHYSRALKVFENSVFAIPTANGDMDYFMNTGEDLADVTKIDCSTMTGDGNETPARGMSPERRFELDKKNKGYATWTLKQDFVDRLRRNRTKFIEPRINRYHSK